MENNNSGVVKTSQELESQVQTRSSWLNCALRDDEAVYWVSTGHYEVVAVDDTGSVESICAFIYCTKWRSDKCHGCLTHSLTL